MRSFRLLGVLVAFGFLSGCAVANSGYDIDKLQTAKGSGSAFTQSLTDEYRQLMNFEADKMYDWRDADYYARKGLRAAAGEVVEPQAIAARDLPKNMVGELTTARADLVQLLDAGAREKAPQEAASAQASFDCWMEQQEENFQLDDIASCRAKFFTAMDALRAAMKPVAKAEPAPAPLPTAAPQPVVVFFGFDKADITPAAAKKIDDVVASAKKVGATEFSVTGHADRAGPEDYNLGLSLRRANAVRDALVARGIPAARVSVAGRGEAEPAVPTPDGVKEQANRRVQIIILQ